MKISNPKRIVIALVATVGILATSQFAIAQTNHANNGNMGAGMMNQQVAPNSPGSQFGTGMMGGPYGYGMMGGMGPGMMGGMGPGMMGGMGPGMMGGMGPGMMGGMGPGMMGGMGPGMMGGMGPGMMGGNTLSSIDEESRNKINSELDSLRLKSWEISGLVLKEAPALRKALSEELPDPAAVGAIYANLFDLKRQLLEAQLTTSNTIKGIVKDASTTETQTDQ